MNQIVKHYNEIKKGGFEQITFKTFEPKPNQQDYINQYIFRYFLRKRNEENGIIYEVSKDTYDKFKVSNIWLGVRCKWKIIGNRNEVEELNKKSITFAKQTIKNLDGFIQNYLKYFRG